MAKQRGLRSPTARTRKTGIGAALYVFKAGIQSHWHTYRATRLSKKIQKLLKQKPVLPLTKALLELEIIQEEIEMHKEFQRAMIIAARGHHQIVGKIMRGWEVNRGRKGIHKMRIAIKNLMEKREKIREKIDHEMRQVIKSE